MRERLLLTLIASGSLLAQPARAQDGAPPLADTAFVALLRTLTTDLRGYSDRPGEVLVAADSATAELLARLQLPHQLRQAGRSVICPGPRAMATAGANDLIGYVVEARLNAAVEGSGWWYRVSKGCGAEQIGKTGMRRGFGAGAHWVVDQVEGTWRVTRVLSRFIT